jgi:hypothetical protein
MEHPTPQSPDRKPSKPDDPPSEGGEDERKKPAIEFAASLGAAGYS